MSSTSSEIDVEEADLGLGDGLKPGGFQQCLKETSFDELPCTTTLFSDSANYSGYTTLEQAEDIDDEGDYKMTLTPIKQVLDMKIQYRELLPKSKRCTEVLNTINKTDNCVNCHSCDLVSDSDNSASLESKFPVYADIPLGTSLRQQKQLFHHHIDELRKKQNSNIVSVFLNYAGENKDNQLSERKTCEEIALKLAKSLQEVEDLKIELEACEQKLDSKYKAIAILKKQAQDAQDQLKLSDRLSKENIVKLSQEIIQLQNEQDWRANALSESQQVWAQQFDRMCQENRSLTSVLELRMEELRKGKAENMAVKRENDELLALLDVQERAKYARTRSMSIEENYCQFSSTELAVLGACRCRISQFDPCGCALAAANLKKEVVKKMEEVVQYKNRRDEAYQTLDTYRKAFEEQLQRNKTLNLNLANLSIGRTSSSALTNKSKAKLALKWLIGSLNDKEESYEGDSASSGPSMTEYELITYLTELLNEKKDQLAHQKLGSQILADRVKILEEKLKEYETEEVFSDTNHEI